jgi:hypothetical protein
MNDLQKELQTLKEKVADLESRIVAEPVAKWQPKGGYWQVDCGGDVVSVDFFSHQKEFGTKRITKEQAERASIEMRRFNRLLALRDELCGDEVVDWTDNKEKYRVYFSHERGCWYVTSDIFCENTAIYFTTQELAQKAWDMLNSGEVEL